MFGCVYSEVHKFSFGFCGDMSIATIQQLGLRDSLGFLPGILGPKS